MTKTWTATETADPILERGTPSEHWPCISYLAFNFVWALVTAIGPIKNAGFDPGGLALFGPSLVMLFSGYMLQSFGGDRLGRLYGNATMGVSAAGIAWWITDNLTRMPGF